MRYILLILLVLIGAIPGWLISYIGWPLIGPWVWVISFTVSFAIGAVGTLFILRRSRR